jgi:hypothetical protein
VWLTGKGGGVKEQENREKKENIKGWGGGEIALIKNSRDTFLSQGRWAIYSKRNINLQATRTYILKSHYNFTYAQNIMVEL